MSCVIDQIFRRNIDYKILDLAHYCGISTQMIYKILNSECKPNVYLAIKICDYFTIINNRLYFNKHKNLFKGRITIYVTDLWIFDQISLKFDDSS